MARAIRLLRGMLVLVICNAKKYSQINFRWLKWFPTRIFFRHVLGDTAEFARIGDGGNGFVVQLIPDLYTYVRVASNILLPRSPECLQIEILFIADAPDGHGMRN